MTPGPLRGLPGEPQGTETQLHTSHFLFGSENSWGDTLLKWTVVWPWRWRWSPASHTNTSVFILTGFLQSSWSHYAANIVKPPPFDAHTCRVWDMHSVVFAFFCISPRFRLRRAFGKIMSLSKKQASCHEPRSCPQKSCDQAAHTVSFFFLLKSNIFLLVGGNFAM